MEESLSLEQLEELEEVEVTVDDEFFRVDTGICPSCNKKMEKFIENENLFNGSMTFHIIKFRCDRCHKVYLDLEQAETYDVFLALSKISLKKPLEFVADCLAKVTA